MIKINYFQVDNNEILDTQSIEDKYSINKFKILGKLGRIRQLNQPLEFDIENHHFKFSHTVESEIDNRPSAIKRAEGLYYKNDLSNVKKPKSHLKGIAGTTNYYSVNDSEELYTITELSDKWGVDPHRINYLVSGLYDEFDENGLNIKLIHMCDRTKKHFTKYIPQHTWASTKRERRMKMEDQQKEIKTDSKEQQSSKYFFLSKAEELSFDKFKQCFSI